MKLIQAEEWLMRIEEKHRMSACAFGRRDCEGVRAGIARRVGSCLNVLVRNARLREELAQVVHVPIKGKRIPRFDVFE